MTRTKRIVLTTVTTILWIALLVVLCIFSPYVLGLFLIAWVILLFMRRTEYLLLVPIAVPFLVWTVTAPKSVTENGFTKTEQISLPDCQPYRTGIEYEKYVFGRLIASGFTRVELTPATGDHGADILAFTPNGQSAVVQCKFYKDKVGQHAVQEAVAARVYFNREVAIVITNSIFSPGAKEFARKTDTYLVERYL